MDENGLLFGSLKNLSTILEQNVTLNENRSFVKWGFFAPSSTGIETIQKLVEANQVNYFNVTIIYLLINALTKSRLYISDETDRTRGFRFRGHTEGL